jgi:hypothetical protein
MALTTEQWAAVRKIVYGIVALAGVGLTAFGAINAEQWAHISAGVTGVIGAVLALINVSPTQYKAQPDSDSAASPAVTDPNTDYYASSEYAGQ